MIYLISRDARFSPNSTARDEAIFNAVAQQIVARGHALRTLDEARLPDALPDAEIVLSMGRDEATLRQLSCWERDGLLVLNSPSRLLRNTRSELSVFIAAAGVGLHTLSNRSDASAVASAVGFPLWLKRGDACAQTAEDIRFVENFDALTEGLHHFFREGYSDFVAEEHVEGDLVKFYGVEGTDFFHYTYPTTGGFSKFGLEAHNGAPSFFPFSSHDLKQTADLIARTSGMFIYGGDAVVRSDGSFAIIDFNDWPSFGGCTQTAAVSIVDRALSLLQTCRS